MEGAAAEAFPRWSARRQRARLRAVRRRASEGRRRRASRKIVTPVATRCAPGVRRRRSGARHRRASRRIVNQPPPGCRPAKGPPPGVPGHPPAVRDSPRIVNQPPRREGRRRDAKGPPPPGPAEDREPPPPGPPPQIRGARLRRNCSRRGRRKWRPPPPPRPPGPPPGPPTADEGAPAGSAAAGEGTAARCWPGWQGIAEMRRHRRQAALPALRRARRHAVVSPKSRGGSMAFTAIRTAIGDGVMTITLSRPERLNAFTSAMHAELREALSAAETRRRGALRRADRRGTRLLGGPGPDRGSPARARRQG